MASIECMYCYKSQDTFESKYHPNKQKGFIHTHPDIYPHTQHSHTQCWQRQQAPPMYAQNKTKSPFTLRDKSVYRYDYTSHNKHNGVTHTHTRMPVCTHMCTHACTHTHTHTQSPPAQSQQNHRGGWGGGWGGGGGGEIKKTKQKEPAHSQWPL